MARDSVGGKARRARFMVLGVHIDGQRSCTLTIETGLYPKACVRPHGAHREYLIPLATVCELVHARASKLGPVAVRLSRNKTGGDE